MTDYKDLIERLRNPARRMNWADREEAAEVIDPVARTAAASDTGPMRKVRPLERLHNGQEAACRRKAIHRHALPPVWYWRLCLRSADRRFGDRWSNQGERQYGSGQKNQAAAVDRRW